jgi:hypothetical protein
MAVSEVVRPSRAKTASRAEHRPWGLGRRAAYLQIPAGLGRCGGLAWAAWLATPPDHVEELTQRRGLELGESFRPGGNSSWVTPADDRSATDVIDEAAVGLAETIGALPQPELDHGTRLSEAPTVTHVTQM